MHPVVIGFKRAHWASVRFGLRTLGRFGMTPARFEVLYVLGRPSLVGEMPAVADAVPMTQARLRQELGVSRTTVSRMLRVLERLGLVTRGARGANARDARTRVVRLTALGLSRLAQAVGQRIGPAVLDRRFCLALTGFGGGDWREHWRDTCDGRAGRRLRAFGRDLRRLARVVGDFAMIWRWREYLDDPTLDERADDAMRRTILGEALASVTARADCPIGCGAAT